MLRGNRELIAGLHQDPQFGPTVMLGVGGILAEAIADVAFRLVPLTRGRRRGPRSTTSRRRRCWASSVASPRWTGPRSSPWSTGLAALAEARPDVTSVDLNPLIVVAGRPIAVDALVEVAG